MSISNCKEFLKEIRKKPEIFYVIHYSCQSMYDDNDGLSPRITSIAVSHFGTEQTLSFSTHATAESLHVERENVIEQFDRIELDLLERFYEFVRDRRDKFWVHWNMRNLTYGFEHLEHRYRILSDQNPPVIPVERRINLNDMISNRYGSNYVKHPRMISLMELNGGRHRHFLSGEEEVEAFQARQFIRMHNSTLCKVGFYNADIKKLIRGKLKTNSWGFGVALDRLLEGRFSKIFALLAAIIGLGSWIPSIVKSLTG